MTYPLGRRATTRDRAAVVHGWCAVDRLCASCGVRTPAGALDTHMRCPDCSTADTGSETDR